MDLPIEFVARLNQPNITIRYRVAYHTLVKQFEELTCTERWYLDIH